MSVTRRTDSPSGPITKMPPPVIPERNAMSEPSGEKAGSKRSSSGESAERSIGLSLPTRWTTMCRFPPTDFTYATVSPSGASAGERSIPGSDESRSKRRFGALTAFRPARPARKPAARRTAAAAAKAARRLTTREGATPGAIARAPVSEVRLSSAKARSPADWKRCSGAFSRQRRTMRSRPGGTFWFVRERSGGSSRRIAVMTSALESPPNAFRPASIS